MADKRIVITGIGVLNALGIGKRTFWDGLKKGASGVSGATLFDCSGLRCTQAGQVRDFDPKSILGDKGLRNLDRTTLLSLVAAQLAVDDGGIKVPIAGQLADRYGVAFGSTMGSIWSISEFDKDSLKVGAGSVNPALVPNSVINGPASRISLKFNIKGFNTTISTGFCASMDAMTYALNIMKEYEYDVVLTGGVEELCEQTYRALYKIGHLAGSRDGKREINCPFDKRRNGIVVGEGACVLVFEEMKHAVARGARIYAEVLGYGTAFDIKSHNKYNTLAEGARSAIRECLDDSRTEADQVDYVVASANSTLDCDYMETVALKKELGKHAARTPVSSIKSCIGDTFSASGAMNIAAGLFAIEENTLPPTINFESIDRRCDLDYVPNTSRREEVDKVLVDCFSPTGNNTCIMLGRC